MLDSHVEGYMTNGISVKDGDVIMDVGANIGVFGVRMLQRGSKVKVFAFEPIPDIYAVLEANSLKYDSKRLIPLNVGLSNQAGQAEFTYFPNAPALSTSKPEMWDNEPGMFENAVKGSLENAPSELWYAKFVPGFLSGFISKILRKGGKKFTCNLVTLSSIIERYGIETIHLLKIDCEGAELSVIQGIEDKDWQKIKQLVMEVHDTEGRLETVKNMCKKHGFAHIITQKEAGFEKTKLVNLFATR